MHVVALWLFILGYHPVIGIISLDEATIVQQQVGCLLYINQLPPTIDYASEGKGSSSIDGYDDSKEAREARMNKSHDVYIEVVGFKKVKVTQQKPVLLKGLDPARKYMLKIYTANEKKLITSFPFSFKAKGSSKLRLSYEPFYTSWRLDTMK